MSVAKRNPQGKNVLAEGMPPCGRHDRNVLKFSLSFPKRGELPHTFINYKNPRADSSFMGLGGCVSKFYFYKA